ncbi:hypothetical protein EDC94DRAFT_618096 [Helicostylum pulchrum]|nr:hypothetical protein EDC94DRAFT_618096 [Helicostylum pulchrum]
MDKEKNIPSSEETTEKTLTVDNVNDQKKKKRHNILRLLTRSVCFACFLWFVHTNQKIQEKIQVQEISELSANYIYPVIRWFAVPLFFIPLIPLALLHFLAVPNSAYPVTRNGNKKSMMVSIFVNALHCHNIMPASNTITRCMYCYYHFFYKSSLTCHITEKIFSIIFFVGLFIVSVMWEYSIMLSYNSVLDTITIFKFARLQNRQEHDLQV